LSDSGFFFKLAGGGQQLCCLRTASPQGIAALAAQWGYSYLDGTRWRNIPSRAVFSLPTGNEASQDARYSRLESTEVHRLVPKGFLSVRQIL